MQTIIITEHWDEWRGQARRHNIPILRGGLTVASARDLTHLSITRRVHAMVGGFTGLGASRQPNYRPLWARNFPDEGLVLELALAAAAIRLGAEGGFFRRRSPAAVARREPLLATDVERCRPTTARVTMTASRCR
jgi:hypothetical protein